jgi:hypothetical protein
MGTDGFKISSLKQQSHKQKSPRENTRKTGRNSNQRGQSAHQILMMSSLSSRLRLIFEWSVAAILQRQRARLVA